MVTHAVGLTFDVELPVRLLDALQPTNGSPDVIPEVARFLRFTVAEKGEQREARDADIGLLAAVLDTVPVPIRLLVIGEPFQREIDGIDGAPASATRPLAGAEASTVDFCHS